MHLESDLLLDYRERVPNFLPFLSFRFATSRLAMRGYFASRCLGTATKLPLAPFIGRFLSVRSLHTQRVL